MRELYRLNKDILEENHDLWILVKKKFSKSDSSVIENIFVDSLLKIKNR